MTDMVRYTPRRGSLKQTALRIQQARQSNSPKKKAILVKEAKEKSEWHDEMPPTIPIPDDIPNFMGVKIGDIEVVGLFKRKRPLRESTWVVRVSDRPTYELRKHHKLRKAMKEVG